MPGAARTLTAFNRLPPILQGFGWMFLSGVLFSLLNATLRYVSLDLHPMVTSFFRFVFGLLFIAPMVVRSGWSVFRTERPSLQVARGAVFALAFGIWYTALPLIPLTEMTAIMFTGPLFVTIGAYLFLREQVHWQRWVAVAVGFGGVLLIIRPGFAEVTLGSLLMLSSMPIIAASQLIAKAQTKVDSPQTIICWQSVLLILFFLPPALIYWTWPTWQQLVLLAGAGVIGTAANWAMFSAFKAADISALQPVYFLNIVWASILGYVIFTDTPDHWTFVGAGIIVACTTYIARREAAARRERLPEAMP